MAAFVILASDLCQVKVVPSAESDPTSAKILLIDFLWLSPFHFVLVYSGYCSSQCHLYMVQSAKSSSIEFVQTFDVASSSPIEDKTNNRTKMKTKISLHQSSNIVQLTLARRKQQDLRLILLIALKDNGDIFIMEINENQLTNK